MRGPGLCYLIPMNSTVSAPITPAYVRELLAPVKAGQSQTHDGPHQIAAMTCRNRFGALYVRFAGKPTLYFVTTHPTNAQQLRLTAEVEGTISGIYLSWGYLAFTAALEDGSLVIRA